MQSGKPPIRVLLLVALMLAALLAGILYLQQRLQHHTVVQLPPATAPTRPVSQPAPSADLSPTTYVEVVLKDNPDFPTTQPVAPVELSSAGHIILHDPLYLDASGNLWLTRSDAPPASVVLNKTESKQVFLTPEKVQFVRWQRDGAGDWKPAIVVPNTRADGFDILTARSRKPIGDGSDYDWSRAFPIGRDRIGVPTSCGMSLFDVNLERLNSNAAVEEYPSPPMAKPGDGHAPVQFAFFDDLPIIWIPPQANHPGSHGAYRLVDKAWFKLTPEEDWPTGIVQIIPLYDGLLQLIADGPGTVRLAMVALQAGEVDERAIMQRIIELSDRDARVRSKAYEELTKYGPALWPIAERMLPASPPETQSRLKDLLRNKISPLLGGMSIIGQKLRLVWRYPQGGALFYCERGVSIPRGDETPRVVAPAWLSVVPGDIVRLIPPELVRDMDPDQQTLTPIDPGRWLVRDPAEGIRYMLEGVGFMPLLRPEEKKYDHFVGFDSNGRFLFRSASRADGTLILDPTLPDANRRLPVWLMTYPQVGWDNEGYPAVQWGAEKVSFRLRDWSKVDPAKGGKFYNTPSDVPAYPQPQTRPTATHPSTTPTHSRPILVDADGNSYYDGKETLRVLRKDGAQVEWPLPPAATGELSPWLVQTPDHRLFLYNQPGRILKIRPTPKATEPFKLEATFTRRIPNTSNVLRMWVDPLGRICMVYDTRQLAIMFPQGYVPAETKDVIPGPDLDEMLKDE